MPLGHHDRIGAPARVGHGCAFLVEALHNPLFNHVMVSTTGCLDSLPELAAWDTGHGKPPRVDVAPIRPRPGCSPR